MQIYTRTGDLGTTRLIGGKSVYKDDPRIHAYGTIDELNSYLGIVVAHNIEWQEINSELISIQQLLFDCGNDFATPDEKYPYRMTEDAVLWLESRIDQYATQAPPIESFILPGGSPLSSQFHFIRTLTRRAERDCVTFSRENSYHAPALKFLNRLSDYFFALARVANCKENIADIPYERSGKVFHTDLTKDQIPK